MAEIIFSFPPTTGIPSISVPILFLSSSIKATTLYPNSLCFLSSLSTKTPASPAPMIKTLLSLSTGIEKTKFFLAFERYLVPVTKNTSITNTSAITLLGNPTLIEIKNPAVRTFATTIAINILNNSLKSAYLHIILYRPNRANTTILVKTIGIIHFIYISQ